MRHRMVKTTLWTLTLLGVMGTQSWAQQPWTQYDWPMHRAATTRVGTNGGDHPQPLKKGLTWVWPPTADIPAEIVVDNNPQPDQTPGNVVVKLYGQSFQTVDTGGNNPWQYPATADRGVGAWPPSWSDPNKSGDYYYCKAVQDTTLATLANLSLNGGAFTGLAELQKLPNVDGFLEEPLPAAPFNGRNFYRTVDDALRASTTYARWTFGTAYPDPTMQGTTNVGGQPLKAGQRYAVYIRYPSSSTSTNTVFNDGQPHPNSDWVFVRVSWGDVNNAADDRIHSRIFMLNFGDTGGYWKRVRSSANEDRYFPYDGVHPITVTLYASTISDRNELGVQTIIPADAVRLVPEALRGDIHAPAASAAFPPGSDPTTTPGSVQRTYFGRDETVSPQLVWTLQQAQQAPATGNFLPIPFDPGQAPTPSNGNNPQIDDPTTSIRAAVFYCFEDDMLNGVYGKLKWRYVARSTPAAPTTIDDHAPPYVAGDSFIAQGNWTIVNDPGPLQSYGGTYETAVSTVDVTQAATATWTANLPVTPNTSYSVFVWIPAGPGPNPNFAHAATYTLATDSGTQTYVLDQRNTDNPNAGLVGTWRRLAQGVRFPTATVNGQSVYQAVLTLTNVHPTTDGSNDPNKDPSGDALNARLVVADAVQIVPDTAPANSVVAAPLIANVTWPSGTQRQVVYFATTDGHVWALDAAGVANTALTTVYWVYPSVDNPDPAVRNLQPNPGQYVAPDKDPNFLPDPTSDRPQQGIDGDLETKAGGTGKVVNQTTKVPDLGPFTSSPLYVEVVKGNARLRLIVIGNSNGRIYALDAVGRTNQDPNIGAVNEPFPATFATAPNNPGIPGTTRRVLTWPTLGRDVWLRQGGLLLGQPDPKTWPLQYPDQPSKGSFAASLTAAVDNNGSTSYVIAPASESNNHGHVYAVDLQSLDPSVRISNPNNNGAPVWQYPGAQTALDPITYPGALTPQGKFIFSSFGPNGGRVYAIDTASLTNGVPVLKWVYPFTSTPPGQPNPGDQAGDTTPFTAPVWVSQVTPAFNNGNEVVFVANTDGTLYALDATQTGGAAPAVLWQSLPQGTTRASTVYINGWVPQVRPGVPQTQPVPALIQPLDTGTVSAFDATTGRIVWTYPDGAIGSVPLQLGPQNGPYNVQQFATGNVWRGADATLANNWMYEGTEGNQDAGEIFGQMRAYWNASIGTVTAGEQQVNPEQNQVDIRLVNIWNGSSDNPTGPFDSFGATNNAKSPANEWANARPNTQGNVAIYEWGDSIKVAAWGAYTGNVLPQVTFRLSSGTQNVQQQVMAVPDTAFVQNVTINGQAASPWVAKTVFQLGRGSQVMAQTPGRKYEVFAQAQINSGGAVLPTFQLAAGQSLQPFAPEPPITNGPNDAGNPRVVVVANPLALTTRGVPANLGVGAGFLNAIGWSNNTPPDNVQGDISEIIENGNRLGTLDNNGNITPGTFKDLAAPMGAVGHGTSSAYTAVDDNGNAVAALFAADRSNLFKLKQPLQLRAEPRDLEWFWNLADGNSVHQATGNVMNPLPWEVFPNTIPNASPDYPNIDRLHLVVRGNGIDLSKNALALPNATVSGGNKVLSPMRLDLEVDVPKYQPANVNTAYYDINTTRSGSVLNPRTLLAPLKVSTGSDVSGDPNLKRLMQPSAGYVASMLLYVDSNNNGRFDGTTNTGTTVQTGGSAVQEVFRQMNVGLCVPPDLRMRTEEATLDVGKEPHSVGYSPVLPFGPSGVGPWTGSTSPFDDPNGHTYFVPFTVKNEGNVNLVNLRVAKVAAPAGADVTNPNFWASLVSDQVEPSTGVGAISGVPFFPLAGQGGTGNIGIVSVLDHARGSNPQFEIDYTAAFNRPNFWPIPDPYVTANNPLVGAGAPDVPSAYAGGNLPQPTLHKPRPGDPSPTVLSIPDVAYGDPGNLLGSRGDAARPKVGIAVPLGTPAGTYSAPIYVFEDWMPVQWRQWLATYYGNDPYAGYGNDGILETQAGASQPLEAVVNPPFTLKVTVKEARLTNAPAVAIGNTYLQGDGGYPMVDVRVPGLWPNNPAANAFGANVQASALRDWVTGNILLVWASNRLPGNAAAPSTPDAPWYLNYSVLRAVTNQVPAVQATIFDWKYEPANKASWWNPLPQNPQYPDAGTPIQNLFPSVPGDVPAGRTSPLVPGQIVPGTERHGLPALAETPPGAQPAAWLFWQGAVYKTTGTNSSTLDTRTFYTPVDPATGAPQTPNGGPYSFPNDPRMPKFAPKPLLLGPNTALLFWYGGDQGRTRLYYNSNGTDLTNPARWSRDAVLPTPGALEWAASPVPVLRSIGGVQYVDLFYAGMLGYRHQAEILMTRYQVRPNGTLAVAPLPKVDNELMVRDGVTQTWTARGLAWVYLDPVTRGYVDANGNPPYTIWVQHSDGTVVSVLQGRPAFDTSSGRLYWNSALGGQVVLDPQAGTITFPSVAPAPADRVIASYIPQSMRMTVTHNDTGAEVGPGPVPDNALALLPYVASPGNNTDPVAFLDNSLQPAIRWPNIINTNTPAQMPVTRLWLFYRKEGSNAATTAGVYYKTMRLMIRLPRGIIRDLNNGVYTIGNHVRITPAPNGPVEVDWVRGRLYFTEADEGMEYTVEFDYARDANGNPVTYPAAKYRVTWKDEGTVAAQPGDQTTGETPLPADASVDEGSVSAFKDPFQDKVWVFWSSTRAGTSDLYFLTLSPRFYPVAP